MREFLKNREKGAVIVMFALFIPLLMLCAGLAIDLGNLYAHKTRLQNAADAAALAGAREFAVKGETVDSHDDADTKAREYASMDMENDTIDGVYRAGKPAITENSEGEGKAENNIYYRVDLTETVPLYFLRIIPGLNKQEVSVTSIVKLGDSVAYKKTPGDELFIIKNRFDAVNSVKNPDNPYIAGQATNFFNGNIVYTNGTESKVSDEYSANYFEEMRKRGDFKYSTQMGEDKLSTFLKSKAKEDNVTVTQASKEDSDNIYHSDPYYQPYDMDYLARYTRERMNLPDYSARTWNNWDNYKQKFGQVSEGYKKITSSMLSQDLAITANMGNGDGNTSIAIDGTIPGGSEPVYLYIDESVNQRLNIDVTASNGRPLRIIYMGTSEIAFNIASGTTFSGTIYAPYASQVLVNAGGANFEGSMIVDKLTLRGDDATYTFKDYGPGGSTDGNGAKDVMVGKNSDISLISSILGGASLESVTWN